MKSRQTRQTSAVPCVQLAVYGGDYRAACDATFFRPNRPTKVTLLYENRLRGKPMHTALQINIILWIGIAYAFLEIERLVAVLN